MANYNLIDGIHDSRDSRGEEGTRQVCDEEKIVTRRAKEGSTGGLIIGSGEVEEGYTPRG